MQCSVTSSLLRLSDHSREMCAARRFCDVLFVCISCGSSGSRGYNLTGVGVQERGAGGNGNLEKVDDGRKFWARFSRRALHSADLERDPRKSEKEFIVPDGLRALK